jgi:hypothetical protein
MALDVLAVIFAILILIKLTILLATPRFLVRWTEFISKKRGVVGVVYLLLAVIVGYYVFSVLDIVEVASVMLFTSILIGFNFLCYSDLKIKEEIPQNRLDVIRKFWLPILIWAGLALGILFTR